MLKTTIDSRIDHLAIVRFGQPCVPCNVGKQPEKGVAMLILFCRFFLLASCLFCLHGV